jgi:hypothetical protein
MRVLLHGLNQRQHVWLRSNRDMKQFLIDCISAGCQFPKANGIDPVANFFKGEIILIGESPLGAVEE